MLRQIVEQFDPNKCPFFPNYYYTLAFVVITVVVVLLFLFSKISLPLFTSFFMMFCFQTKEIHNLNDCSYDNHCSPGPEYKPCEFKLLSVSKQTFNYNS